MSGDQLKNRYLSPAQSKRHRPIVCRYCALSSTSPCSSCTTGWSRQRKGSVHTGLWLQPPSIHHNQRQQSTQLGPRNTQGHGLIVNTVKTQREGGWTLGDDGNSESLGGVWGKIGEERGEEGQIDGSPISSLMVSKRGNMRECYPVKQVTQRKGGGSHTHP